MLWDLPCIPAAAAVLWLLACRPSVPRTGMAPRITACGLWERATRDDTGMTERHWCAAESVEDTTGH